MKFCYRPVDLTPSIRSFRLVIWLNVLHKRSSLTPLPPLSPLSPPLSPPLSSPKHPSHLLTMAYGDDFPCQTSAYTHVHMYIYIIYENILYIWYFSYFSSALHAVRRQFSSNIRLSFFNPILHLDFNCMLIMPSRLPVNLWTRHSYPSFRFAYANSVPFRPSSVCTTTAMVPQANPVHHRPH